MNIRESLLKNSTLLAGIGINSPELEAEVLIRHLMNMDRAEFFASLDHVLNPKQLRILDDLIERRMKHEPLAYIVGHREFYGLDFKVDSRVLIPRQETELLVEKALEFASNKLNDRLLIADVGTGSGAIAVSIAYHLPGSKVYATDSSAEALAAAKTNAKLHDVLDRITFLQSDLLEVLPTRVDLIVSNPPYIKSGDIAGLSGEVRNEPLRALDGGKDGLDVIRRLLKQAPQHIKPNGCILLEIDPSQAHQVTDLTQSSFQNAGISIHNDLLRLPRAVQIFLAPETT